MLTSYALRQAPPWHAVLAGFLIYFWGKSKRAIVTAVALIGSLQLGLMFNPRSQIQFLCECIVTIGIFLGLLGGLSLADRDVQVRSAFPNPLFLLPLRSPVLALMPLAIGSVILGIFGLGFGILVLEPKYGASQMWWPGVYAGGTYVLLQAISWASFPHVALRLAAGLVPGLGLALAPMLLAADIATPVDVSFAYSLAIFAGAVCCVRAVSRARAGIPELSRQFRFNNPEKTPHKSPISAQIWLDKSSNGLIMLSISTTMTLILAGLVATFPILTDTQTIQVAGQAVAQDPLIFSGILLATFAIFATAGVCVGPVGAVNTNRELDPLLCLRPISTYQLIEGKIRMAAGHFAKMWGINTVGILYVLLLPSPANSGNRPTLFVLVNVISAHQFALCGLVYLTIVVWAAKAMISGMWHALGLLPKYWMVLFTAVLPILAVVAFTGGVAYPFAHPEVIAPMKQALPYVMAVLLLGKVGLMGISIRALRARDLVEDRVIAGWLAAWLGVGAVLFAGFMMVNTSLTTFEVAAILFSVLPLGRMALTPILVANNRHRN